MKTKKIGQKNPTDWTIGLDAGLKGSEISRREVR